MISFSVNDMTCGHCVSNITKAIKAVDQGAEVRIDLATHLVRIDSPVANASDLSDAIKEAGYTPIASESSFGPSNATAAGADTRRSSADR